MKTFVAIDPKTGIHLRDATELEIAAYNAQERKAPFDRAVRVGDVLVDTYTGPSAWFGGAGF